MGIAIIKDGTSTYNINVPNAECTVLKAILALPSPCTVGQIKRQIKMDDEKGMSEASIYSLTSRLAKRNLIVIEKKEVEIFGTNYARLFMQKKFENTELIHSLKSAP